jgi:hypothetical protein
MKYRLLPSGYVDETGPHRGVPPTEGDLRFITLMTMHRKMFAEGKIEFQLLNPMSQSDLPSVVEFTQELPIDEVKRRWPNTKIPGDK